MSHLKKKICYATINWNKAKMTANFLNRLTSLLKKGESILVVDNGSSEIDYNEMVKLLKHSPGLNIIRVESNSGFSGGVNLVAEYCLKNKYDGFFMLNNDLQVDSRLINKIRFSANSTPSDSLVSFAIRNISTGKVFAYENMYLSLINVRFPRNPETRKILKNSRFDGACFYVGSEFSNVIINVYGNFINPNLFLYCEEIDIAFRSKELNLTLINDSSIVIDHDQGSSGVKDRPSMFYYYTLRNRLYLISQWITPVAAYFLHLYLLVSRLFKSVLSGRFNLFVKSYKDFRHRNMGIWSDH